jgi:hypothetical protein
MEVSHVTLHGDGADRFADAFVDTEATEQKRSINKRGVRNIHRFEGETSSPDSRRLPELW